jgi:hypothetical protein
MGGAAVRTFAASDAPPPKVDYHQRPQQQGGCSRHNQQDRSRRFHRLVYSVVFHGCLMLPWAE